MVMEETHVPKVVGSNPCTRILDGHIHIYLLLKFKCRLLKKTENKQ